MHPHLDAHLDDLRKRLARAEGERDDARAEVANLRQAVEHLTALNEGLNEEVHRLAAALQSKDAS